jgi:hypothetical protein
MQQEVLMNYNTFSRIAQINTDLEFMPFKSVEKTKLNAYILKLKTI